MKAAVFHGPRDVRFEEIDKPILAVGEVLLKVGACGICGSDLHTYRHGMFLQLGSPVDSGRVLGHEFSGEVVEINGDVPGVSIGDRVTTVGMGGNAEYIRISAEMATTLVPINDDISYVEAATTEPLATSLHAANLGAPADGETHVIIGAGIIGLGILQCIKAHSTAKVIVADLSDKRLAKAEELGADQVINVRDSALTEFLSGDHLISENLLSGTTGGVDVVYDCAGMGKNASGPSVLEQALSIVRQNGKVVIVAVFEQDITLDYNIIVRKGVQVHGSWAWEMDEFIESARLIASGKIDRKPLVSHTFALEQASEAYETQLVAEEAIKVVFTP